jgi:hypothetical protein
MIRLLLPVSDWPIIIIRLGALPLVVSHLFGVTVLVLWVGLEKAKETKLGCEKYFGKVKYGVRDALGSYCQYSTKYAP